MSKERALCSLCGEPMADGEEMFKFHGYSGPCPKPPLPREQPETVESLRAECEKLKEEVKRKTYLLDWLAVDATNFMARVRENWDHFNVNNYDKYKNHATWRALDDLQKRLSEVELALTPSESQASVRECERRVIEAAKEFCRKEAAALPTYSEYYSLRDALAALEKRENETKER